MQSRNSANLYNILAGLVLLATLCLAGAFGALFLNPPAAFQPPPIPTLAEPPTATATSRIPTLPPAWTDTPGPTGTTTLTPTNTVTPSATATATITPGGPTFTPSVTLTLSPTATLVPSNTPTPTDTPEVTATPTGPTPTPSRTLSALPFTLQANNPTYMNNWVNTAGCNWLGIGGQAFDLAGNPVVGLLVHLDGGGLSVDATTGTKPEYGPGGYEFYLDNHPKDTVNVFRVQLRNQSGAALSDTIVVDTFNDCGKNLILVNFVQNH